MNRTMSKKELYNLARHYGKIVSDERVETKYTRIRITEFKYSMAIITVVMVNGRVAYCDYN